MPIRLSALAATAFFALLSSGATAQTSRVDNICASPDTAVQEEGFVQIGGIPQWVTIRGDRCSNPVILLVHGGPGNPMSPFSDHIYGRWEKDYTIVQWDQRGAGRTWGKNRPSEDTPLSVTQMRDDGIEVAHYLTQHLGKRKVILMGGSWSSVLAVHMAKAEPGLFSAYLGWSQMVSYRANPPATYSRLLDLTRQAGDQDSVSKLEKLGPPPWTDPRSFGIMRRIDRKYEAMKSEPAPSEWWQFAPLYATPEAQADYTAGEDYSFIQFVGMKGDGMFSTIDLPALGTRFEIPIFLLQGEEDLLTLPEVSRAYFNSLSAPQKAFILLPRTGHDPNAIMIEAQFRLLQEKIRPLAE